MYRIKRKKDYCNKKKCRIKNLFKNIVYISATKLKLARSLNVKKKTCLPEQVILIFSCHWESVAEEINANLDLRSSFADIKKRFRFDFCRNFSFLRIFNSGVFLWILLLNKMEKENRNINSKQVWRSESQEIMISVKIERK